MWTAPVTILDGEDENALIARYVELSARYRDYSIFHIMQEVFRGLPDAELRAGQAAIAWGNSLEIKERIRKAIANGGSEPDAVEEISEEEANYRAAMAIFNDETAPWTVRHKFFNTAQQIKGYLKDTVDAKGGGEKRRVPNITFVEIQQ